MHKKLDKIIQIDQINWYNIGVDPSIGIARGFLLPRCPKGAVCQCGYSSEQVDWVNQTVPLAYLI